MDKLIKEIKNKIGNNFEIALFKKNSDGILVFKCDNTIKEAIPSILFLALNPITNSVGVSVISPEEAIMNSRRGD